MARVWTRPANAVSALALVAGVWAVAGSQRVFPYLSDDHDEGIYLLQAEALLHGHLFPPAPRQADAFLPWLSVLSEGRFVVKYTPVHASIVAVGMALGSARWSLGLIAAAVVVLTYLLAREVLEDRRAAVLATVFLTLSPLFVIQSATFLPYCSSLLLLEAFTLLLLRGLRLGRGRLLGFAGLLFGLALFARPFDALVFALPLVLYAVVSQRHRPATLARHAGAFALGAAVPVVAMLAYFAAATGNPFRSPFNLLEPQDTLGFGARRLSPTHPDLVFTPAHGWYGVIRYWLLTSFWCFGGLVLMGLFVAGVWRVGRQRGGGPQPWLALVALSFAGGYVFFWGTYGTSLPGSLTAFLGPFYFVPVLVPVTFLAARHFTDLWQRDRPLAGLALAGMVAVSGYLLVQALEVNLQLSSEDRRLYRPITAGRLERAVVFVPPIYGPHLLHPFAWLRNGPGYDGPAVYALDRGDDQNLTLLRDFPGRAPYRFRLSGRYRASPPDPALTTSLERLSVRTAKAFPLPLSFQNPTADPVVVVSVSREGRKDSFVLDIRSQPGKRYDVAIDVTTDAVVLRGPVEAQVVEGVRWDGWLSVSISVGPGDGGALRPVYERRLAAAADGESLTLLLPGSAPVNELGPGGGPGPEPLSLSTFVR